MDKAKNKNIVLNPNHYWRIFLPLAFFLLLMLRYPIRLFVHELLTDIMLYGLLSFFCFRTASRIYRTRQWQFRNLLAVIILCASLSAWQVIDLAVLRHGVQLALFGSLSGEGIPEHEGIAFYGISFPNPEILCHQFIEKLIGNETIAISVSSRNGSWFACGG